ncbi:MAG: hypothetical protein AAGE99_02065 [Chlamydiota bacterium]
MKSADYRSLIDDSLTYIQRLLPPRETAVKFRPPPATARTARTDQRTSQKVGSEQAPPAEGERVGGNNRLEPDVDGGKNRRLNRDPDKTPSEIKPEAFRPKPFIASSPTPIPDREKKEGKKAFIELEMPNGPSLQPIGEMQKVFKEIAPDLHFHTKIPADCKAKRIKEAWKEKRSTPAVPILFQGMRFRGFVQKIAKAVDTVYGSSQPVEITPQKKWDLFLESKNLRLIIAPDRLIFDNKTLLSFYQETPQQKKRTLGKIPLLLLPDLSLYYQDPYLKRSLWNMICDTIDSLPSS